MIYTIRFAHLKTKIQAYLCSNFAVKRTIAKCATQY